MSKSREQVQDWLRSIDITDKTVLDIGAGPPSKWAKNWTKGEPKSYTTVDIEDFGDIDFIYDINKHGVYNGGSLKDLFFRKDVVFCLETLEHVWNPYEAVLNLGLYTSVGGVCYISTPFINPIHDKWDYLRYTFQWYEKILLRVGFKKVEVKPRVATDSQSLMDFYYNEGMRMSKITMKKYGRDPYLHVGYMVTAWK